MRDLAGGHAGLACACTGEDQSGLLVGCDRGGLFVSGIQPQRGCRTLDGRNRGGHEPTICVGAGLLELGGSLDALETVKRLAGALAEMPPHDRGSSRRSGWFELTPQALPFAVAQIALASEGAPQLSLALDAPARHLPSTPNAFVPKGSGDTCGGVPRQACDCVLGAAQGANRKASAEPRSGLNHTSMSSKGTVTRRRPGAPTTVKTP